MKQQLIKSILAFCILYFAIYYSATAQIQQNNVRVVDTVYTPAGYPGGALTSKLWLPSITNGAAIVLMHPWGGSVPNDLHVWAEILSSYGYVVLSIDYYEMWNEHGIPCVYPAPVRALKTGVEFIRKNSLQFGCYSGKVASISISGGSVHSAQTIIWDNDDAFFGTDPGINDHLDASVLFCGMYNYYNHVESPFFNALGIFLDNVMIDYFSPNPTFELTKGNPFTNINNITTPILMFHGTADEVFNVAQAVEFRDALTAHGKNVTYYEVPGGGHTYEFHNAHNGFPHFSFSQLSDEGIVSTDTMIAWLARTLEVNNIHCPYSSSYWKNHSADWNADAIPMMLGTTNSYSKSQLLAILNSSSGDVSIKLSQELIAAKLNLANNSYASPIASNIIAAGNLIGNRAIPIAPTIVSNSSQGNQMTALKNTLNAYNNGTLTPNCNNSDHRMAMAGMAGENNSNIYSLGIFPNPVSNATTIYFSLSQSQKVSLKIFDVNGRLVATLANEQMQAGVHEIKWNANNAMGKLVPSGIYLLRIEAGNYSETKKLSVIK